MRYNHNVKDWVIVGSLGVIAISVMFGGTIATSIGHLGESGAEREMREYNEARREMKAVNGRRSVDGELAAYEKDLLESGYWVGPTSSVTNGTERSNGFTRRTRASLRDDRFEASEEHADKQLAIQNRREEMKRWSESLRDPGVRPRGAR